MVEGLDLCGVEFDKISRYGDVNFHVAHCCGSCAHKQVEENMIYCTVYDAIVSTITVCDKYDWWRR